MARSSRLAEAREIFPAQFAPYLIHHGGAFRDELSVETHGFRLRVRDVVF